MEHKFLVRDFSKEKVNEDFSKVAWFYDIWANLTESKAADKVLEFANIKNGESVLEVAVGTGILFEKIVKLNAEGNNSGIEISTAMKKEAEKRMRKTKANYKILNGSAYKLPFDNSTFDLLINNFMIDLLPEEDFDQILLEFNRVLKPNGKIVISTMTFGKTWYTKIWDFTAKTFPKLLTGCRPVDISSTLKNNGFNIADKLYISQNTFPSLVISASK